MVGQRFAEYWRTARIHCILLSERSNILSKQLQFYLWLIFGFYCLVQGCGLAMSASPVMQLLGLGLWIWLPACAYYTWRAYQALTSAETAAPPAEEERFESEEVLT